MLVLFSLGCGGCCLSLLQFVFASGNEIADRILRTLHCVFVVVCVCVCVYGARGEDCVSCNRVCSDCDCGCDHDCCDLSHRGSC